MRILAIDFGDKRIGLAISDPLGYTAQGLTTLPNTGKKAFFEALSKLCSEREVGEIVFGLPVNMNGTMGPKAQQVMGLVAEIEEKMQVPVKTWDERLSSRQVTRVMIEGGLSREKQRKTSDQLAAIVILQSYLELKRNTK